MNLRGQVVVALWNCAASLNSPSVLAAMAPVCLIVRAEQGTVCLLADEVGNVLEVAEETFEPAPETLPPRLRSVILGVHKLEGQLMHVLDTDRACEIHAASLAAAG